MRRNIRLGLIAVIILAALFFGMAYHIRPRGILLVELTPDPILADGTTRLILHVRADQGFLTASSLLVRILEGSNRVHVESVIQQGDDADVSIRPGILPGHVALEISARGFSAARVGFETLLDAADRHDDGTPEFLRLGPEDERSFRHWFTFLAESQYYRTNDRLPAEINDCAALIRFAYREAMREHGADWVNDLDLEMVSGFPAIRKYNYPFTPFGAALFRIRPGPFNFDDTNNGNFAQFADAKTLQSYSTHFVSRDLRAAQPGDLLFYKQLNQGMPFHAMVFLGQSHFDEKPGPWVVYHTGPIGHTRGEIRRPSTEALLHHQEPRWRPLISNNSFLGVYRWNILR